MPPADTTQPEHPSTTEESASRSREWRMFLFIIVFLFPLFTVALVGAYGFSIWMYQLLAGPPAG